MNILELIGFGLLSCRYIGYMFQADLIDSTNSVFTEKEVLSPKRVTSAPSRKERVSFRDNPVQLSGGWGGGKKRAKVNK